MERWGLKLGFWGWLELVMAAFFLIFSIDDIVSGYYGSAVFDISIFFLSGWLFYRKLRLC